ncbi:hypothetical protein CIB95_09600 [Lottiidibacillus patelloidae]|uniref:Putative Flp pilus-assembly TadG-like N-terminal domain-containing protein n=1 Tax=Lottiidibacillus patelloidae TaxID=2670334 RepID=A0A263BTG6_9BACI|nr:Tad domain-containing protein [Lottiidibacillus patelloidae]OZM57014.1 hypothetical protein CIB95_09600 [Lottiidibacillus patelloidae]
MKWLKNDERGQSLVLMAFGLTLFLGFVAFSIDLGWVIYHQVKLDDAADLAVLSGAQSLPENPVVAELSAREVFTENYSTDTPIQNLLLINGGNGVKIVYEYKVNLFFLPLLGKSDVTLSGESEAVVEPVAMPGHIVPIAINSITPMIPNVPIELVGDLNDPSKGNFGLVDPTSDNSLGPNDFEYYIANDYKGEKGMPQASEYIMTKTGSLGQHIKKGLDTRLAQGKNYILCPVVDFSLVNGKTEVEILGYARFKALVVTDLNGRHVTITGEFDEFIDTKAYANSIANYYGVKSVKLIK